MIRSMTGFGAATCENDDYRLTVEIKTVNQRFFDVNFYMPKLFFAAEIDLRKLLNRQIARGKTEVRVTFTDKRVRNVSVQVDREMALCYNKALNELSTLLKMPRTNDVTQIAAYDGVLTMTEVTDEADGSFELLCLTTEKAVAALVKMREKEGANIHQDFLLRLNNLQKIIDENLIDLSDKIVEDYRARIEKKLAELLPAGAKDIDPARLVQEVAMYADRIDFSEEVVRLKSHLEQFGSIITQSDNETQVNMETSEQSPVGRKLDFLLQEINREVNTIGSKASDVTAAKVCVTLKSEVEKLREQVQNIE